MPWVIYDTITGEMVTRQVFKSYDAAAEVAFPDSQIIYLNTGEDDSGNEDLPEEVEI